MYYSAFLRKYAFCVLIFSVVNIAAMETNEINEQIEVLAQGFDTLVSNFKKEKQNNQKMQSHLNFIDLNLTNLSLSTTQQFKNTQTKISNIEQALKSHQKQQSNNQTLFHDIVTQRLAMAGVLYVLVKLRSSINYRKLLGIDHEHTAYLQNLTTEIDALETSIIQRTASQHDENLVELRATLQTLRDKHATSRMSIVNSQLSQLPKQLAQSKTMNKFINGVLFILPAIASCGRYYALQSNRPVLAAACQHIATATGLAVTLTQSSEVWHDAASDAIAKRLNVLETILNDSSRKKDSSTPTPKA